MADSPRNYTISVIPGDGIGKEVMPEGVRVLERGAWFVSSEHDDAVIDATLAVVREAAREVAPGLSR